MVMAAMSPRATAVGQRLLPSAIETAPITTALGATQADGAIEGLGHGSWACMAGMSLPISLFVDGRPSDTLLWCRNRHAQAGKGR